MAKTILLCVLSIGLGLALSWTLRNGDPAKPGAAAEPGHARTAAAASAPDQSAAPAAAFADLPAFEGDLTPEERVNVAVYENVNRSVVNINTKSVSSDRFFFYEVPAEGAGSGSILDKQGHVLTNFHVVEGAQEIQVTLFDGKSYEARLVGKDASSDIAVLKIDAPASSLFPVTFGDSIHLKVGQKVYAIGNPFGLERTLTTGIVSSLNRTLPGRNNRSLKNIIQIDAAINPGNSGGPLLDSHSRLIGMNTAIASRTGQNTGVGFAIPISSIARTVPQLLESGKVLRADIGIARVYETEDGLVIASMVPHGPAETAGLRGFKVVKQRKKQGPFTYDVESVDRSAADTIVGVNGQKTLTANAFLSVIDDCQPGDEVTVSILRDGKEMQVRVKLTSAES
ncbi:MAG TPA: trypsin-like peptidase domain-containing protein [Pirellulales bacterium]|jgi:S1-C subfamily serine protease|nr:trypsin-like peptidase domain-containing protein [Pirellulales bacterium]